MAERTELPGFVARRIQREIDYAIKAIPTGGMITGMQKVTVTLDANDAYMLRGVLLATSNPERG